MTFIVVIIWIVLAFVLASAAKGKGRSYGAYLALGLFLSPVIGFIVLMAVGDNKEELEKQNITAGKTKICPFCANEIKSAAIVCQFCGRDLPKEEIKEAIIETPAEGQKFTVKTATAIKGQPNDNSYDELPLSVGDMVVLQNVYKDDPSWYYVKLPNSSKGGWCLSKDLERI